MLKILLVLLLSACSQQQINQALNQIQSLNGPLTKEQMSSGLKEALLKGLDKSTGTLSQLNGFLKNDSIKIPFPKEANIIKSTLDKLGLNSLTNKVELSLNRAAEDATKAAKPIFMAAIKDLTFTDVMKIVKGNSNEATNFLRSKTENKLFQAFSPQISKSLKKVDATKYWNDVIGKYNDIPFMKKVNPDLNSYVTKLAIDGLFTEIAKEEDNIRKNPKARTTELLRKVFSK